MHLQNCKFIFDQFLVKVKKDNEVKSVSAVRPLDNGKYALVMGLRPYVAAKLINIEKIPCVIRETTHKELTQTNGIPTSR